jgi:hypothetical protein
VEDEPTEQWRLGEVEINKIIKGFPNLVATGPISPPIIEPPDPIKRVLLHDQAQLIVESPDGPRPISKVSQRWTRQLEKRKLLQNNRQAENQAIDDAIKKVAAIKEAMLDSGATSNFIQSADGLELTGPSFKTVSTANRHVMKATMTALLPLRQLKAGAREAIIIPEMSTKALMSVKQLADQRYTTIFHPYLQGVTVHDNDGFKLVTSKPPLL